MVAFRELVPEVQSKAVCRTQFIESLNKCNNALSDVAVMSQSYFKRPWAANRLNTAREALKDATTNFAECCPPPMVGMAKMKMTEKKLTKNYSKKGKKDFNFDIPKNECNRAGTRWNTVATPHGTEDLDMMKKDQQKNNSDTK